MRDSSQIKNSWRVSIPHRDGTTNAAIDYITCSGPEVSIPHRDGTTGAKTRFIQDFGTQVSIPHRDGTIRKTLEWYRRR